MENSPIANTWNTFCLDDRKHKLKTTDKTGTKHTCHNTTIIRSTAGFIKGIRYLSDFSYKHRAGERESAHNNRLTGKPTVLKMK